MIINGLYSSHQASASQRVPSSTQDPVPRSAALLLQTMRNAPPVAAGRVQALIRQFQGGACADPMLPQLRSAAALPAGQKAVAQPLLKVVEWLESSNNPQTAAKVTSPSVTSPPSANSRRLAGDASTMVATELVDLSSATSVLQSPASRTSSSSGYASGEISLEDHLAARRRRIAGEDSDASSVGSHSDSDGESDVDSCATSQFDANAFDAYADSEWGSDFDEAEAIEPDLEHEGPSLLQKLIENSEVRRRREAMNTALKERATQKFLAMLPAHEQEHTAPTCPKVLPAGSAASAKETQPSDLFIRLTQNLVTRNREVFV